MLTRSTKHSTRFSDLDTQLHITSRTYELLAEEARFELLAEQGYDFQRLNTKGWQLHIKDSAVRFFRQQMPGVKLRIESQATQVSDNMVLWNQEIYDAQSELACEIHTLSELQAAPDNPTPHFQLEKGSKYEPGIPEDFFFYHPILDFSGSCQQNQREFRPLPSLRNFNWTFGAAEIWRFFEDGRWFMFENLGIDFDLIQSTDTTAFFMGAAFHIKETPLANEMLIQKTWFERIDKIRVYFRQDIFREGQKEPLMSSREFILFVSVSRSRPRRPDPRWLALIDPWLEIPQEQS